MVVVWSKQAKAELQKAYLYILLDSVQSAEMVRDNIINLTIDLAKHPQKHSLDKFKQNNDGTWRAFEIYHYRISYRIMATQIRVVRLRHTSKSPLSY